MNQPRFLSVHISLPCNISISTVIVHSHTFSRPIQHHKNWLCYRIHPSKYLLHPIFNDFMHLLESNELTEKAETLKEVDDSYYFVEECIEIVLTEED